MTMLIAFSLFFGALLGLRFNVYTLVPTIGVIVGVVVVLGVARIGDLWSLATLLGLAAIGIQLGYLCGASVQFFLSSTHAHEPSMNRKVRDHFIS
jgi:hypothetical protein